MESFLNAKYSDILSLGANCYPKLFISKVLEPANGETQLFDYIGASMWSINALIRADFEGITNPTNFAKIPIVKYVPPIVTNTKYNLRFVHDLQSVEAVQEPEFIAKMQRRVDRFTETLKGSKNILCIRYQENPAGRIVYPENPVTDEYQELVAFVALVKDKYGAEISVIYINTEQEGWNDAHNILSVKISSLSVDHRIIHNRLKRLFEEKDLAALLSGGR